MIKKSLQIYEIETSAPSASAWFVSYGPSNQFINRRSEGVFSSGP